MVYTFKYDNNVAYIPETMNRLHCIVNERRGGSRIFRTFYDVIDDAKRDDVI
jgi:hypothetical protein